MVVNFRLPHPIRSGNLPKSNLPGFWIGGALFGTACLVAASLGNGSSAAWVRLLPLAGISCLPLAIALAELRSGYAWKNLAEGGRGVARTAAPGRFWRSISFHLLLTVAINAFNVWMHLEPEQLAR